MDWVVKDCEVKLLSFSVFVNFIQSLTSIIDLDTIRVCHESYGQ